MDPIVQKVVEKLVSRSLVGSKKYGKTLKQDDTHDIKGWLIQLQEELLDASNYIEKIIDELNKK